MTPERIAEIRRLAEAATKGPWLIEPGQKIDEIYIVDAPTDGRIARMWNGRTCREANAEFIAVARNALPELLDEVERLRARCERLEKVREAAEAYCAASRALEIATENHWPIKDKIPLGMTCGTKVMALEAALAGALEGE